jgi:hypothetical protein
MANANAEDDLFDDEEENYDEEHQSSDNEEERSPGPSTAPGCTS